MKSRIDELPWNDDVEFDYVRRRVDIEDAIWTIVGIIGAIGGAVFFILEAPV